ncbi:unnamed protein product [Linum trigynum]|uniref:Uncharacterized protein n=1 Tax=Linum trigynum TaxID=586398 RepID=A0AAV2D1T3_9ROSI
MGESSSQNIGGGDQSRHNDDGDEGLALTLTRPTKKQKKPEITANDHLPTFHTKPRNWFPHEFVPPAFPASSSYSSELILFNSSSSIGAGASGPDDFAQSTVTDGCFG